MDIVYSMGDVSKYTNKIGWFNSATRSEGNRRRMESSALDPAMPSSSQARAVHEPVGLQPLVVSWDAKDVFPSTYESLAHHVHFQACTVSDHKFFNECFLERVDVAPPRPYRVQTTRAVAVKYCSYWKPVFGEQCLHDGAVAWTCFCRLTRCRCDCKVSIRLGSFARMSGATAGCVKLELKNLLASINAMQLECTLILCGDMHSKVRRPSTAN